MRRARSITTMLAALVIAWVASGTAAAALFTTRLRPAFDEPAPSGFDAVRLTASDGLTTGAWLRRSERARAAIVMVHGNGSSRTALIDSARALADEGLTVMPISVRAHGDSEGMRNDLGWSARRDVIAAVEHLRARDPEVPVIVRGASLGAAAAIFAAGELGDRAAGYVLIAPYASLDLAVQRRTDRYLPRGIATLAFGALWLGGQLVLPEIDRIVPADAAARMPRDVPAVIVVGGADDRAPESDARAIAASLPRARIVVLPGLGHEAVSRAVGTDVVRAMVDEIAR